MCRPFLFRPHKPSLMSSSLLPTRGWSAVSFTARIERPPLYHGGSASKKDGLAASLPPSPFSPHLPRGWAEVPFDCAHRTSILLSVRVLRARRALRLSSISPTRR